MIRTVNLVKVYQTDEVETTALNELNIEIKEGEFVLLDMWAKLDQPDAVYTDLTKVGYVGNAEIGEILAPLPPGPGKLGASSRQEFD